MSNYKNFSMFIGYPRSGHSLIGAFLNAHPKILIAHEYDVVKHVERNVPFNKIIEGLIERNQWFQQRKNVWNGYSYQIPNQFQDVNMNYETIGDKKGGKTTHRFMENNELIDKTLDHIPYNIKWVHVIRNPFNIISSMTRYKDTLEHNTALFIKYHNTFQVLKSKVNKSDIINVYHEDLYTEPEKLIVNLVEYLDLTCSDDYIKDCVSVLYDKPSNTKDKIKWPPELTKHLNAYLKTSDELQRYLS